MLCVDGMVFLPRKPQERFCPAADQQLGRKGWPLERVLVRLRHSRVHAADCVECDKKPVLLDHIDRTITLEGALDAAQRDRLMAIADKCPVHRTLSAPIRIETHRA